MGTPRYPNIEVQLTGRDGNAMAIISMVSGTLRRNGVEQARIVEFINEAMSGDYTNVLATVGRWVEVS